MYLMAEVNPVPGSVPAENSHPPKCLISGVPPMACLCQAKHFPKYIWFLGSFFLYFSFLFYFFILPWPPKVNHFPLLGGRVTMTHPSHLAHQTFTRVSLNCHKPEMLDISHQCCSSSQELLNWHHSYPCKPVYFTLIPIPQPCFSQWGDAGWTMAWPWKRFDCLVQAEFSSSTWWQCKYL